MRVLVLHPWGIGDLIMATPMLKSLALSGYEVDLILFSKANVTILEQNDFITNIHQIDSKWKLVKFFGRYDYLVATAGVNPKKIRLLNFLIGAKEVFAATQIKNMHRIDMNLQIVSKLIKKTTKEPYIYLNDNEMVIKKYLNPHRKNIGFGVGSGKRQRFKRWDRFAELIERIEGNKLLFIGPDEDELEGEYAELDVTIVKESLANTIQIISRLDLFVGNDNGLSHIAYATRCPTVTIFGMTNEKETGGYGYCSNQEAVFLDMECRPCFNPTNDNVGCGTFDCLKKLDVDKVYKACRKFL